ncbi:MAG: hypothetical protein RH942_12370 [Kiloniellaceae bacterium]
MAEGPTEQQVARQLARLYEVSFGGRERGRYRISMKHLRGLMKRRRLLERQRRRIAEELFELGFVFIDMETFFVVLAQGTFSSYRRVNDRAMADLTTNDLQE